MGRGNEEKYGCTSQIVIHRLSSLSMKDVALIVGFLWHCFSFRSFSFQGEYDLFLIFFSLSHHFHENMQIMYLARCSEG